MEHKELRDKIAATIEENEGDLYLQADGVIAFLKEEGILVDEESEDLDLFDDEEDTEDE